MPCGAAPHLVLVNREDPRLGGSLAYLQGVLSAQECQRLERFRRSDDRERYLLGRGVLRLLLGAWLKVDPAALLFTDGSHGKPGLIEPIGFTGIAEAPPRFNVSHSGDLILLAFHPNREVGVDLERLRPVPEWESIARRYLPATTRATIQALPSTRQGEAFLAAWCHLEAGLKARGVGLHGLPEGDDGVPMDRWSVRLPAGYVGAAAMTMAPPAV